METDVYNQCLTHVSVPTALKILIIWTVLVQTGLDPQSVN